jgi:protein-L-isoaspartate(D-aspartate) O-methyltransferase
MNFRDRIAKLFGPRKPEPEDAGHASISQYYWTSFGDAPIEAIEEDIRRGGIVDERIIRAVLQIHPGDYRPWELLPRPAVVAGIVEPLQPTAESRVLEIGTGTGYLTAVLAVIARRVITIEISPTLAQIARGSLDQQIEIGKVHLIEGDGTEGHPEEAPYDRICVHASAPQVPPPLLDQLGDGGRLFMAVGSGAQQELHIITRQDKAFQTKVLAKGGFSPLVGRYSGRPE